MACATVVAKGSTDSSGAVTLDVPETSPPYGFDGYFDVASPSLSPYLYFLEHSLSEPKVTFELRVPTPSTSASFYASAGVTPDAARGSLDVQAVDCHWVPAENVTVTATSTDGATTRAYLAGSAPSRDATATDRTGEAVFMNVLPGVTSVEIAPNAVGRTVAHFDAVVRPGAISKIVLRPNR
jgi:hypothetical protein